MKRLFVRLLQALLLAALALYPLYLAAGNAYLRSGDLERRLNRRPERLLVQVDSAWTLWPGIVHVRGFRIRNQTRVIQWWASLDEAAFTIDAFNLSRRELRIYGLRGRGVSFRLRRIDVPTWVRPVRRELQPSIPGLENPPVRPPVRAAPARPRRDPWRIRLARADLDGVREIWLDELRFTGEARVAGGFDLTLRRRLRVDPTRLQVVSGAVALGGGSRSRPLLVRAAGRIDGEIAPYSPAEHRGWDVLRFATGQARIDGTVPGLAFLDDFLRQARWLTVEADASPITADLRVRRGQILPGSRLEARPDRLTAQILDYRTDGAGRVRWEVGPDGKARIGVRFDRFQTTRTGYGSPHVRGRNLTIEARGARPALVHLELFSPRSLDVRMPDAEVPALAFYNAYLPPGAGLKLTAGHARMAASFQAAAPDWKGHGDLRLEARSVAASFDGKTLRGDLLVRTHLQEADLQGRRFDISGTKVDVSRVSLDGGPGGWWARAHLDRAIIAPGEKVFLRGRLESTLADPRPILAFVAPRRHSWALRWIDRLLDIRGIGAVADVAVGEQGVTVDKMAVAGGEARIEGRIRFGEPSRQGILYARYGRWDVGLELAGTERSWKVRKPRQWYENRMAGGSRIPER